MKFNILFTISGAGKRFKDIGIDIPKPLIPVRDRLMIEWATKSCDFFDNLIDKNLIFTVRKEHVDDFKIDETLKKIFGNSTIIISVEDHRWPRGQAGHALSAKEYIDNDNPLFIYSCDTYSVSPAWQIIMSENPDGIIPCFEAYEDRFSFAKLDSDGYVCEVAEKKVISNLATTGHYYFSKGSDFVNSANKMIEKNDSVNGEFYVAPLYNYLIGEGKKIRVAMTTENWVMGTPEELQNFIQNYPNKK